MVGCAHGEANESVAEKIRASKSRNSSIPRGRGEFRLELTGDFNALETIEHMTSLMRPMGYYERITLDFANVCRVDAIELYRLFTELATAAHFNHVEIHIVGIQFNYLNTGVR